MCISPIRLKHPSKKCYIDVPCGKCMECVSKRINQWSFRLIEEMKHSSSAYFFTLTYEEDLRPVQFVNDEMQYHFEKIDIQKMIRSMRDALRYRFGKSFKFKYFVTSEYGPQSLHPHYHGFLFNLPFSLNEFDSWLRNFWKKGFPSCSVANERRCYYIVEYLYKQILDPDPRIVNWERPWLLCSKGIGLSFLDDNMRDYMLGGEFGDRYNLTVRRNGYDVTIPKYYRDKVFVEEIQKEKLNLQWKEFDQYAKFPESALNVTKWRWSNYFRKRAKVLLKINNRKI